MSAKKKTKNKRTRLKTKAARAAAGGPDFFERYGEDFHPQLGMGYVEVWMPVIASQAQNARPVKQWKGARLKACK
jgi:hypothetical protein